MGLGGDMIVFGHTPREWLRRARYHKKPIIACVVSFILGALVFLRKTAATMTVKEFENELKRIREKALRITTKVGTRQDRSYRNQKRGNFYGN